jgi:hypothetical protein
VKPACVTTDEMPSRVAPLASRPLIVLPSASVIASLAAVALVIFGFPPPAVVSVFVPTTRAESAPMSDWPFLSVMPAFWLPVVPSPAKT